MISKVDIRTFLVILFYLGACTQSFNESNIVTAYSLEDIWKFEREEWPKRVNQPFDFLPNVQHYLILRNDSVLTRTGFNSVLYRGSYSIEGDSIYFFDDPLFSNPNESFTYELLKDTLILTSGTDSFITSSYFSRRSNL